VSEPREPAPRRIGPTELRAGGLSEPERARRIGLNETIFRAVDDRVGPIAETLNVAPEQLQLVCECDDIGCAERIEMSRSTMRRIHS